jgi:hypothetical protein
MRPWCRATATIFAAPGPPTSRWRISAALFDLFMQTLNTGGSPEEISAEIERKLRHEFSEFLAVADGYQQFGLTYVLPRAKGTAVLDPNEAWLLPDEKQWAPTLYFPVPFDERLLAAARAYRAPIPAA